MRKFILFILCTIATHIVASDYIVDTLQVDEPTLHSDIKEYMLSDIDLPTTLGSTTSTSGRGNHSATQYTQPYYDDDYIEYIPVKKKSKKRRKKNSFNSPKTNSEWGLAAGYTSKRWRKKDSSGQESSINLRENKDLHGIQVGLRYNPLFKYGFGLDIGVFYEYYHTRYTQKETSVPEGKSYDLTLNEHIICVPIHLEYRLNFSRSFQIFVFGGIAADYVISGNITQSHPDDDKQSANDVITDIYGTYIPSTKNYNIALSYGGGIRFGAIQFNASSTYGILNGSPSSEYTLMQDNPLNIVMSIMF